jgi:hypothetical protein
MKVLKTGVCTGVIMVGEMKVDFNEIEDREYNERTIEGQRAYRMEAARPEGELREVLEYLFAEEVKKKQPEGREKAKRVMTSRLEIVNKKRKMVADILRNGMIMSLKKVAKSAGCSLEMVTTVRDQMMIRGDVSEYSYNNLHSEEDMRELHSLIEEPKNKYFSTRDYKRVVGKFSVKKIRKELKELGLRWKKMPRKRVKSVDKKCDKEKMQQVISHIVSSLGSAEREVLYADEMKFPLNQTPSYFWQGRDREEEVYNNRSENITVTAIALCSTKGFVAVQYFLDEVKAVDFLYFMQEVMERLPKDKEYSVLVDNAGWHIANLMKNSDVWRFLTFNVPGQYRVNLIENSFSGVRAMWRQRPEVESIVEVVEDLNKIFFDGENSRRFEGYYYNHLRAMLSYFEDY